MRKNSHCTLPAWNTMTAHWNTMTSEILYEIDEAGVKLRHLDCTNQNSQAVNGARYQVDDFLKQHLLRWLQAQVSFITMFSRETVSSRVSPINTMLLLVTLVNHQYLNGDYQSSTTRTLCCWSFVQY